MVRALVVGMGSIGGRHARLLRQLGCDVGVISRRPCTDYRHFVSLAEGLECLAPDYVVIATETAAHRDASAELAAAGYAGLLLVEKPLGVLPAPLPPHHFRLAAVAYNLRFHPVLDALACAVRGQTAVSVQVYCGQYLPSWRPDADYRRSYSADPAQGGGVLRDLSHELDYIQWLFGDWRRLSSLGGRLSTLDIRSDDCWGILLETERCPMVTVQVNYLDRPGRREIVVNTNEHTFRADLVRNVLITDGVEQAFSCQRDDTYLAQHQAMLAGDDSRLCTLEQGEAVMELIAAVERAGHSGQWVVA